MREQGNDYDDGYGPPTLEDDAWYTHAVASLGYPKPKRDPKPAEGQLTIQEAINALDADPEPGKLHWTDRGPRAYLGRGVWALVSMIAWFNGSESLEEHYVTVEEAGWYVLRNGEWMRDDDQRPELSS